MQGRSHHVTQAIARVLFALALAISWPLAAQAASQQDNYLLGSGDLIQIQVFDEANLSMQVRLGDNGMISYPLLGDLLLSNKTTKQVEELIYSGLLGDYLVQPSVQVSILEYRPIFISGEVEKPGAYPYQPGLTIGKAIALAQGTTDRASLGKIKLISGNNPEHTRERVKLSVLISPGDIITVPASFF